MFTFAWIFALRVLSGLDAAPAYLVKSILNDMYSWGYIILMSILLYSGFDLIINGSSKSLGGYYGKTLHVIKGFRDYLPLPVLGFLFYTLGGGRELTHLAGFPDSTACLIKLEEFVFTTQLTQIFSRISTPLLTEYLSFIYFFYPWLIILVSLWLGFKGEYRLFRGYVAAIVFASCTAYAFFMVLPAVSPEYVINYDEPLTGGYFYNKLGEYSSTVRDSGNDCCLFPSLHVALSMIPWLFMRLHDRRLDAPFAVLAVSEWISTVYLRRHFGVDVLAGLALGYFCYKAALHVTRNLGSRRESTSS